MDWIFDNDPNVAINQLKDTIINVLNDHKNFDIDLIGLPLDRRKIAIQATVNALRAFNNRVFGKKYLVLRVEFDSVDGNEQEFMRIINNQSINHLSHLLDRLNGRATDSTEDFNESDEAILFGFIFPKIIHLEWYEFERPNKAGGYFPYYNCNKDLDLSTFGIYRLDQVTPETYKDNCFIIACINSKLFTDTEIELMRSIINTRWLPREELVYFAELFNCYISISYYNDELHKINKAVKYNINGSRSLRLLLRSGHYMLYHDELVPENKYKVKNLNQLLTRMFQHNEFDIINDFNIAEKFIAHEYEFERLEYSPLACKPIECNIKHNGREIKGILSAMYIDNKFKMINRFNKVYIIDPSQLFNKLPDCTIVYMPNLNDIINKIPLSNDYKISSTQFRNTIQQIKISATNMKKVIWIRSFKALTAIDFTGSDIEFNKLVRDVRQILINDLKINLDDYNSLPSMSFRSAIQYGCFNGVYQLSGIVQAFAKRCIHGGLIKTLYDGMFEVDNVTCLDINSSYGTSMTSMKGIPIGTPKPFYDKIPNDSCYAFIQCEISNIKNDKLGRFGFITEGIQRNSSSEGIHTLFIDSVLLNEIRKYVECDIRIINGYSFNQGFNTKIKDFINVLYNLRSKEHLNKFGKNMISCLYGKTLQSTSQFKIITVPNNKIHEYIALNGNFIFEIVKSLRSNCYIVKLLRSINHNYNIPQLGVQVLSESRSRVNGIIDYCNMNDIQIYSIKTDCFVINSDKVNAFSQKYSIGNELGQMKVEYQANRIKYTSPSCYKAELIDGNVRMRGLVN